MLISLGHVFPEFLRLNEVDPVLRFVDSRFRRIELDPVLLEQVVNDRLLLSIDPTGEQQKEEGERWRQRIQRESVPERPPQFKDLISSGVGWAEFPEAQALADCVDPVLIG